MKTTTQFWKPTALALGIATLISAPIAQAELLGAGVGVGIWSAGPTGTANLGTEFDVEKDTGLGSNENLYVWAYLNHPVPLLPNVMLESTMLESTGSQNTNLTFMGQNFSGSTQTKLTMDHLDATLYWGLPLPIVDINFGFGVKQSSGELSLTNSVSGNKTTSLDFTMPYGYLGVHLPIPVLPITLSADTKAIGYDGSSYQDTRAKVRWDVIGLGVNLGIEAGYRIQSLVIDGLSVDLETDIQIEGMFAGVTLVF